MYGIDNVQAVHSGYNDCILEWKLFEKMNGRRLFITNNKVYELNDEYIVPVSYKASYPNFKYYLPKLPHITCDSKEVFSLTVHGGKLRKFPTNFNGMIIEHLINSMVHVHKCNSQKELIENKKKLRYIGKLPSILDVVPMIFNLDGSMSAIRSQDKELEEEINAEIKELKKMLTPLIDYVENNIFEGKEINSQELVIHPDKRILALCDLSTENSILEIKGYNDQIQSFAEQLYYESKGRKGYILLTQWDKFPKELSFGIHEVTFNVEEYKDPRQIRFENAKQKIEANGIELVSYSDCKSPVRLKCRNCGNEWNMSYNLAIKKHFCPNCSPIVPDSRTRKRRSETSSQNKLSSEEQRLINRFIKYKEKLKERSDNQLILISYKDSKSQVRVKCQVCEREWETRADHLLERPYCTFCKWKKRF